MAGVLQSANFVVTTLDLTGVCGAQLFAYPHDFVRK